MEKYSNLIQEIEIFSLLAQAGKVYGPYKDRNNCDREFVIVVDDMGNKTTKTLARHIYEKYIGRALDPDMETVDHLDTNKFNNDINNLRIVPRSQHSGDDTRRVKMLDLECAQCKKHFERSPRLVRDKSKKGKVSQFCSRQCAGKYSRDVQLGLRERLPVQPPPASEYYKRKYQELETAASFYYLIAKYS